MIVPPGSPVLVGVVSTRAGLRLLARRTAADAVEMRIDALLNEEVTADQIEAAIRGRKQPVLLTLRIPTEGGKRSWKIAERRALFLRLLPLVEAVDVELATAKAMETVLEEARRLNKAIILSAHSIGKPAPAGQFAKWVDQFAAAPATILKIAAHIQSWRDLQQLAAVLVNYPEWQVAVMGLGPHAAQSREVLAALGSRLVYGYLDEPSAPGQPSAAEVRKMVSKLRGLRPQNAKRNPP